MDDRVVRRPPRGKRIAVAQIAPALGDVRANIDKHLAAVERARELGAELLVFPELSLTGYRLKDTVPEVAVRKGDKLVAELAAMSSEISLIVGLVEEDPQHHFYNSAFFLESGHLQAVHRKVYLPTYGMFDEQRYFARGRRVCAFSSKVGRIAVLICEDMLHPTAVTIAALDGASTVIVPSASPAKGVVGQGEVDANGRHWETYNRAMARTLGLHIIYANRAGVEDGIAFWGGSEIVAPNGDALAKAAYYEEDLIHAVVSDDAVRRQRVQSPVLRDEDMDLTVNELCRLRERPQPAEQAERGPHGARTPRDARTGPRDRPQPRGPRAPRRRTGPDERKPRALDVRLAVKSGDDEGGSD